MRHSTTRMLFAYWDQVRGNRSAPQRSEINPADIRHILADTFILAAEPQTSPNFRLAGTRLCALMGRELKDVVFSALWTAESRLDVDKTLTDCLAYNTGVVGGVVGTTDCGLSLHLEILLLPLALRTPAGSGYETGRIIGSITPFSVPLWMGAKPITTLELNSFRVLHTDAVVRDHTGMEGGQRKFVVYEGGKK
jgi:hypothetical protein